MVRAIVLTCLDCRGLGRGSEQTRLKSDGASATQNRDVRELAARKSDTRRVVPRLAMDKVGRLLLYSIGRPSECLE